MTSHRWQPGNVYGTSVAPQYNAITYTWGRWMLQRPDLLPGVHPIHIKGVDWSVPRIDPEHFTRDEFLAVIHKTMDLVSPDTPSSRIEDRAGVEFLWLDIACIDQRPQSPEGAAEVGRQADIFRGARYVFSWLTTFFHEELTSVLSNISLPRGSESKFRLPRPLDVIQQNLEVLVNDPWFSSLWTLQEAFLRQDAMFIARDCHLIDHTNPSSDENEHPLPLTVKRLEWTCRSLVHFINTEVWDSDSDTTVEASTRHQALTRRVGLDSGWDVGNPLAAFIASSQRTTSNEADRVYGIQQIFGFRLGSTAVGAPQRIFTRPELELQLSREIITRFPLMSQLFVTSKPVEFGQNWRITPESNIYMGVLDPDWVGPEPAMINTGKESMFADAAESPVWAEQAPTNLCSIGTKVVDGHTWGYFKGRTIPFASLLACTESLTSDIRNLTIPDDDGVVEEPMSLLVIELDKSDLTDGWPNGWKGQDDWVDESEGCRWLADEFPGDDLIVLGLSSFSIRAFGLILVRHREYSARGPMTYWQRIGYCEWWMTNMLEDEDLRPGSGFEPGVIEAWEAKYGPCLRSLNNDWIDTEGLFG